jgi:hypothetical protein
MRPDRLYSFRESRYSRRERSTGSGQRLGLIEKCPRALEGTSAFWDRGNFGLKIFLNGPVFVTPVRMGFEPVLHGALKQRIAKECRNLESFSFCHHPSFQ